MLAAKRMRGVAGQAVALVAVMEELVNGLVFERANGR